MAGDHLNKGDQVYIEGKLKTRSYERDNQTRYITEVVVDNMTMLGKAQKELNNIDSSSSNGADNSTDDLPF